jgi:ankyrin repeat protein
MRRGKDKVQDCFLAAGSGLRMTFDFDNCRRAVSASIMLCLFGMLLCCGTSREDDLITSARTGDLSTLKARLAEGVNTEVRERQGRTALMLAAENGHAEIVRILVEHGADLNAKSRDLQLTSLMYAVVKGHPDIVENVTEYGADVNARDGAGRTALMLAVQYKNRDLVHLLLNKGARPDIADAEGRTALVIARYHGYEDIAELLRLAGPSRQ